MKPGAFNKKSEREEEEEENKAKVVDEDRHLDLKE